MALLRLMALGPLLAVRLPTLRVGDLVLPALAGMGRTKTWWSVLPIVRVCGVVPALDNGDEDGFIASDLDVDLGVRRHVAHDVTVLIIAWSSDSRRAMAVME